MKHADPKQFKLPQVQMPVSISRIFSRISSNRAKPIKFNNVIRDGMQANLGTNPSAAEILNMITHVLDANYDSIQLGGGTFMDLFIAKGRDEWGENSALFGEFKDMIESSALIRGAFLTGYSMNPQDVVDAFIVELAKRGLNEVTNFHGLNDFRVQKSVFEAVQKARDAGYKIRAPKVVCVEDNPNITVAGCIKALREQKNIADSGIYLKNASGKIDPEFVRELIKAVAREFPGEEITFHTHNNHGLGYATSTAAVEAAVEVKADLAIDTLPHPLAEGTAQISARRMKFIIDTHPDPRVRARSPDYSEDGERPDFDKMYETRHRYARYETVYDRELFEALYEAGMAGGATSTIKGIDGMMDNLVDIYKNARTAGGKPKKLSELNAEERERAEKKAMIALAKTEAQIKTLYGFPTNVTPYQKMLTEAAAWELVERRNPQYLPFTKQRPAVVNYLTGGLGIVPLNADVNQIKIAFEAKKVLDFIPFEPADEREPLMEATRQRLIAAGYENPSTVDVLTAAITYAKDGFDHVMRRSGQSTLPQHLEEVEVFKTIGRAKGIKESKFIPLKNIPQQPPEWPDYLIPSPEQDDRIRVADVGAAIGAANLEFFAQAILEKQKISDGFYKTGMGNEGYYKREVSQRSSLKRTFENISKFTQSTIQQADLGQAFQDFERQADQDIDMFIAALPAILRDAGFERRKVNSIVQNPIIDELMQKVVSAKGILPQFVPSITKLDMAKHIMSAFPNDPEVLAEQDQHIQRVAALA